jgi:aspartate-semialdehyde dehydrogenase
MNNDPKTEVFSKQIAFNVIPQIDKFIESGEDTGMTKEEWKMVVETKKILDANIEVCANCVRMPVFIGHAEMVNVELENPLTPAAAKKLWRDFDGVSVIDRESDMEYITPAECAGEDDVFVSRIRADNSVKHGLNFWCVSDNMRKGAALNSIQIAETLIKDYL